MKRKDFSDIEITVQNKKNTFFEHENYIAGTAPFLRGINSTMYLQKPLKTHILVDFSSPEKSNTFIKEHLLKGYFFFVLDINTGTSHETVSGVSTPSIEAMKILLHKIPLEKLSIILSTNNSILTVLSLFIAATKQLKIPQENLNLSVNLTPKNTIIDSYFQQNTVETILKYTIKNLPNFNTIAITTPITNPLKPTKTDVAYFLAATSKSISYCISKGIKIDTIAQKISYNYTIKEDYFFEISIIRATRMLWAKMLLEFTPKEQQSLALQIHALNNFNNYNKVNTAFLSGIQSILSNNLISDFIQQQTFVSKTVDPWAGSATIEKLTEEILNDTWQFFKEIQKNGDFSKQLQQESVTSSNSKAKENKENLLELIIKKIEKYSTLELLYKNIKN